MGYGPAIGINRFHHSWTATKQLNDQVLHFKLTFTTVFSERYSIEITNKIGGDLPGGGYP